MARRLAIAAVLIAWIGILGGLKYNSYYFTAIFHSQPFDVTGLIILIVVTQIILSVLVLPCSPITVLIGSLFQFQAAIIISLIGTLVASAATFFIGKYRGGEVLSYLKINQSRWRHFLSRFECHQFVITFLVFINPVLPASSSGYVLGYLKFSFKNFFLGATLGNLPLQIFLISAGEIFIKN